MSWPERAFSRSPSSSYTVRLDGHLLAAMIALPLFAYNCRGHCNHFRGDLTKYLRLTYAVVSYILLTVFSTHENLLHLLLFGDGLALQIALGRSPQTAFRLLASIATSHRTVRSCQ